MNQLTFVGLSSLVILALGGLLSGLILTIMYCHPNSRKRRRDARDAKDLGLDLREFMWRRREAEMANKKGISVMELRQEQSSEREAKKLGITVEQLQALR